MILGLNLMSLLAKTLLSLILTVHKKHCVLDLGNCCLRANMLGRGSIYRSICIPAYLYMHIYIYTYVHIHMHTYTDIYACTYMYICIHAHIHICTDIHIYMDRYVEREVGA